MFKDFYLLAEDETPKEKYLYVIGLEHPLKFFNGNRAFSSVFSKNNKLLQDFEEKYGDKFSTVHQYYEYRKANIQIVDITKYIPQFNNLILSKEPIIEE